MAAREKDKKPRGILFITFIILSMVSYVVTAYIFHTKNAPTTTQYSAEWFNEYSRAYHPPSIPISPPQLPNITPEYIFQVQGKIPSLVWRYEVLDKYIQGKGWYKSNYSHIENYTGESEGETTYVVHTPIFQITPELKNVPLVTLWDNINGISCSDFLPYSATIGNIKISTGISMPDEVLYLNVSSETSGSVGISYAVHHTAKNFTEICKTSATINETKKAITNNADLEHYTELPEGYSRNSTIQSLLSRVRLDETATIHEQVKKIINFLLANYEIKPQTSTGGDPVIDFISSGGGSILGFINTTAVLLRALDIPCRIIVGFAGGVYDQNAGYTLLRLEDAYMWIEVWDARNYWVPYEVLPWPSFTENIVPIIRVNVDSPRTLAGLPAAYINETITITAKVTGRGANLYPSSKIFIIDQNESTKINYTSISRPDNDTLIVTFTINYSELYLSLGKIPNYGVHVLTLNVGSIWTDMAIILLRRTVLKVHTGLHEAYEYGVRAEGPRFIFWVILYTDKEWVIIKLERRYSTIYINRIYPKAER